MATEQPTLSEIFDKNRGKIEFEQKGATEFSRESVIACGNCNRYLSPKTVSVNSFDETEKDKKVESTYLFNCPRSCDCSDKSTVKVKVTTRKEKISEDKYGPIYEVAEIISIEARQTSGKEKVNIISKQNVDFHK